MSGLGGAGENVKIKCLCVCVCCTHCSSTAANSGLLVIRNELWQIKICRPLKAEDDSIACALNKSSFNTTQHTALYRRAMAHLLCDATPLDVNPTVKLFFPGDGSL